MKANRTAPTRVGVVLVDADATLADLDLSGGTLSGSGTLTISNVMNWTGGEMNRGWRMVIAPGAMSSLAKANAVRMRERTLENAGTVLWTGAGDLSDGSTVLTNRAFAYRGGGSYNRFDNAGTFRKRQGTGANSFGGGFAFCNLPYRLYRVLFEPQTTIWSPFIEHLIKGNAYEFSAAKHNS